MQISPINNYDTHVNSNYTSFPNNQNNVNYQPSFQGLPKKSTLNNIDELLSKFIEHFLGIARKKGIYIEFDNVELNNLKDACKGLKENLTQLVRPCHKGTTVDIQSDAYGNKYHLEFQNSNLPKSVRVEQADLCTYGCVRAESIQDANFLISNLNRLVKNMIELNKDGDLSKKIDKKLYDKARNIISYNNPSEIDSVVDFFQRLYKATRLDKFARDLDLPADCAKTMLKTVKEQIINTIKQTKVDWKNRKVVNQIMEDY